MSGQGAILVVDDTQESLQLLAEILGREGYEVRPADSGPLALASAAANPPALILLDIRMPGMDGFEVCRRLKAGDRSRHIPVVFISAASEVKERVEGLRLGAVDFVIKPFQRDELLARVRTQMELSRLRTHLEQQVEERTAALQSSQALLLAVTEGTPDLVYVKDTQGRYLMVNTSLCRITGKARDEILGRDDRNLFPPDIAGRVMEKDRQVMESGVHQSCEETVSLGTGTRVFFSTKGPVSDAQGRVIGLFGISRDITKRKQLEAELEQHQLRTLQADRLQSLGEMATGIAHELNQPLAAIRFFAEGLSLALERHGALPAGKLQQTLGEIDAQVERMDEIINHLRAFSRDNAAEDQVPFRPAEVMVGAMKLVGAQLRAHGIQVDMEIPAGLPLCLGRPYQLEQVLLNLINNARDALDERQARLAAAAPSPSPAWQPALVLRGAVDGSGRWVRLAVADNGGGIPEAVLPRIFDPFFTTKEVGKGTGLGLAIVQGIIAQHQGRLEVENHPGEGVTFALSLPAVQAAAGGGQPAG